jgi:hypothetical protein
MRICYKQNESALPVLLYAGTIFLSAFLLFWVQLFVAKLILPQLGGSPAVWTTCLVFFQVLLLLGYLCSNWLSHRSMQQQIFIQVAVEVAGLSCLPIVLKVRTEQLLDLPAVVAVLILLASSVALPFLALSGISPLLQHWFERMGRSASPYAFYGASNLGSMASLILYPLWIEPHFGLALQAKAWAVLYTLMLILIGCCGFSAWIATGHPKQHLSTKLGEDSPPPNRQQCRRWLILSAIASSLLSGTTICASVKIAPFPMLWAFFLGLYLLSLVLVFAPTPIFLSNWGVALVSPIVATGIIAEFLPEAASSSILAIVKLNVVWVGFFLIAWACHGELARTKPAARYLTRFYLWIALGGALGGAFNALIAPVLFKAGREYEIVLILSLILLPKVKGKFWNLVSWSGLLSLAIAALMLANGIYPFNDHSNSVVAIDRSFFGSYVITDDTEKQIRYLRHGITLHGTEFLDPAISNKPVSYYSRSGPLGDIFNNLRIPAAHVGVVGLGSGTIAAYSQPGEIWKFYEIDPLIIKFAQTYFSFLKQAQAPVAMQPGDARIELSRNRDLYDILIIDAFTSDAIPQHLLTQEAMQIYLSHLTPDGVIAFHISNRYLTLAPILERITSKLDLHGLTRIDEVSSTTQAKTATTTSQWVAIAQNQARLQPLSTKQWQPLPPGHTLWTDDLNSIISTF